MVSDGFLGFILLMLLLNSSQVSAKEVLVGGKDGWVVKPSEDYNNWAQRYRFQVNDTLRFKYNKESDSVLVVKKEEYDSCHTNKPKQKIDDGDSIFKLTESGLFYFITGNVDHCKHGQKMIVLVMAVRPHQHPVPPPATALPPPHIPSTRLITPAPSPSKSSSSVNGGAGVWVILILAAFA